MHKIAAESPLLKQKRSLEVYTLGKFLIKSDTDIVSEHNKGANKIWEIFKFLLTNRGRRFFPEDVLEILWPGQEYAEPRGVFRYHVHRIRQALEQNKLLEKEIKITSSHGCYFLEINNSCWLDIDEFEHLSRRASKLSYHNPSEAEKLYYQAISLYKGEYIPEVTGSWVYPIRNYYRHLYLENILELIEILKSQRKYSKITEVCRSAFVIEPYEEDLHLRYMEALLEEDKKAQALSHYEYITELMYHELGVKPSNAMQKIYQAIRTDNSSSMPNFSGNKELLENRYRTDEALLCEPEFFRFLLERERRRVERDGSSLHIGLLTIAGPDYSIPAGDKLERAVEELKQLLSTVLRKSDVLSHWNETQFALLLPGMYLEQAEKVLQRINEEFKKIYPAEEVFLRSSVHSIFTWE